MSTELPHKFRLGEFDVDRRSNELHGQNGIIPIEPLVMNVLVCLARKHGEVVTRDTIVQEVWNRPTTDQVLDRCISELRGALGDSARQPEYIKTYPKAGYKLLKRPILGGGCKVLIVDDEQLIRHSFSLLLRKCDDEIECFEAVSCEDAIAAFAHQHRFDLIFLDLGLPGVHGLGAIEIIRQSFDARIVILSGSSEPETIRGALEIDVVAGYMPKLMDPALFPDALKIIRKGGRYVPEQLFMGRA